MSMMKRMAVFLAILTIGLPWTCFVGTLAAAEKPVAPATTKSKGKRIFFTGHSFFILGGYMAKKVDLLAKAAGKEKHELVGWRYSGSRSGAVDKWWQKGADHKRSIVNGELQIIRDNGGNVWRKNKDKSITMIASIYSGKRTDFPKDEQITLEKIK